MCSTCGCGSDDRVQIKKIGSETNHDHYHEHTHDQPIEVNLEQNILHQNQLLAERNKGYFQALNIYCINLVSSPGSGKTTFLERTLQDLKSDINFSVIEGDQQTDNDAERINKLSIPVVQINTGKGCHLDAHMILHALQELQPPHKSVLMIENVGNLVCPALFDLGEEQRIVIISTTEGDDKPLKYPDMFHGSHICIINKIDLLPYLNCNIKKLKNNALKINPNLLFFEVSATSGEGMQEWYKFLKNKIIYVPCHTRKIRKYKL